MHTSKFSAVGPAAFLIKLRDKFAPAMRLWLRTTDGLLPYDSEDLVATGLAHGRFESEELAFVTRALPTCRGVVDVGANFGLYTLLASRRIAIDGRVVAFEASPIEYKKLSWTIACNGLANVVAVLSAISSSEGETVIYESECGAGALNRIDRPAKETGRWRSTTVPMTSLDAWFRSHGAGITVDLIKIDVEGHELPVLYGGRGLIGRYRPVIMIEVNASRASVDSDPERIWSFIVEAGYRWYGIDDAAGNLVPVLRPGDKINLVAVPERPGNEKLVERLLARDGIHP